MVTGLETGPGGRIYTILTPLTQIKLLILIGIMNACSSDPGVKVVLENTLDVDRPDAPIVLKRADLGVWSDQAKPGQFLVVKDQSGKVLPSQQDDLNGDGEWDELAFQYSLQQKEKVEVVLHWTDERNDQTAFASRAHAYLGYRPTREGDFGSVDHNERPEDHEPQSWPYLYQFEGPGWESDLVAYRIYFDKRNGKDIFGKTRKGTFLDSIGLGENYHELQPWGMDVLKVGNSLGAGSLAMLKKDSLYRLGQTSSSTFQKIADGPVRAIIKLSFGDWQVDNNNYDVEEVITIWGGKRWYQDEVALKGSSSDTLVTGIVNMFDITPARRTFSSMEVLANHGRQSENKDMMGMALLVPKDQLAGFGSAPKEGDGITLTDYMALKSDGGRFRFWFYTGWELEDKKFASEEQFLKALEAESLKLSEPVKITVNK